jgi:hypothetical protein
MVLWGKFPKKRVEARSDVMQVELSVGLGADAGKASVLDRPRMVDVGRKAARPKRSLLCGRQWQVER